MVRSHYRPQIVSLTCPSGALAKEDKEEVDSSTLSRPTTQTSFLLFIFYLIRSTPLAEPFLLFFYYLTHLLVTIQDNLIKFPE